MLAAKVVCVQWLLVPPSVLTHHVASSLLVELRPQIMSPAMPALPRHNGMIDLLDMHNRQKVLCDAVRGNQTM